MFFPLMFGFSGNRHKEINIRVLTVSVRGKVDAKVRSIYHEISLFLCLIFQKKNKNEKYITLMITHKTARYAHNDGGKCFMDNHNADKLGLYTTSNIMVNLR